MPNAMTKTTSLTQRLLRYGLYAILLVMAFVYLMPLWVMLLTSLKDVEEIRTGTLLSLPGSLNFDAYVRRDFSLSHELFHDCDPRCGYFYLVRGA